MHIVQPGLLLYVEHYVQCVAFYRDKISLPVAYFKESLTCFELGSAYLMVEEGGVSSIAEKSIANNPVALRFNVLDIKSAADHLREPGVAVELQSFDWGEIGVFMDPDGNRCELKTPS
jgi:lactoylglutathione lyase